MNNCRGENAVIEIDLFSNVLGKIPVECWAYKFIGNGWCRGGSTGSSGMVNSYYQTSGQNEETCRAQCNSDPNCFGFGVSTADHQGSGNPETCFIHIYEGAPVPSGWDYWVLGSAQFIDRIRTETPTIVCYARIRGNSFLKKSFLNHSKGSWQCSRNSKGI